MFLCRETLFAKKTQVLPFLMVFGVFISLPVTETESSGKVSVKDRSSPSPCIEIRLALSTVGCLAVHRSPISRIDRYSGNPLWGRCWPRFAGKPKQAHLRWPAPPCFTPSSLWKNVKNTKDFAKELNEWPKRLMYLLFWTLWVLIHTFLLLLEYQKGWLIWHQTNLLRLLCPMYSTVVTATET